MRKLISRALFTLVALVVCGAAFAADAPARVLVNDREVKLNPPIVTRDGKAYVALRAVAAALHAETKWDDETKTAIVTLGNKRTKVAQSSGITIRDTLYLPLRTTGEAVGCTVEWDNEERAVRITSEAPCPVGGG